MLFNSFVFIFAFLPLSITGYFLLNHFRHHTAAKALLVAASLYFYAFFNWSYLPIIISSIAVNYLIGKSLSDWGGWLAKYRKTLLSTGILFNIGLLGYFKYTDFFIENINAFFGTSYLLKNILLPLGISFFTFQQVALWIATNEKEASQNSSITAISSRSFHSSSPAPLSCLKRCFPNSNPRRTESRATAIFSTDSSSLRWVL